MSYRDPKQYIDTQSMQIQQNLQRTLANVGSQTVANINKIHEENAKKVEEIRANADARVEKAQNSIIQAQSKNPTADFGDLNKQLKLMNNLLLKDPTKRTAEEKTFITSMQSIGDTMGNMLKNTAMAQEAMLDQINKNPGTMGAIDPKADPELYAKLSVLANRTEGRTVAKYKTNKNGQVVFSLDVYEKTKDGERFVGNVINDNVGTTQMPNIIPDVGQEMTDAITRTLNSNDFTSEFSEFLENGEKVYKNKKTGARISREDFKAKLRANAMPIIMGLTEREKASLYNNVLKRKGDDFAYSGGRLTELQKNTKDLILADAFMEDMMKRAELQSNVLGKTFDVTPSQSDSKKIIVKDFEKGVKNASKNITTSKGVTYMLTDGTPFIIKNNKVTQEVNPNAKYVYTPKGDEDSAGVPIEVNYWKRVPANIKDLSKGYKYEINLQEILDTFGGDQFRKL